MTSSTARKAAYSIVSIGLGVWTFLTINSISGPAFEPIMAACTSSEYASVDEFASATGYHVYNKWVGLGALDFLVCLITQFLLELRQTYPEGILVWGSAVVLALPYAVLTTTNAGRSGARGLMRYPVVLGMCIQFLGISVVFPLLYIPAMILGEGTRGAPLTTWRILMGGLLNVPGAVLTVLVFVAATDSELWTVSAGLLGGPIVTFCSWALFFDKSTELQATKENVQRTAEWIKKVYQMVGVIGILGWYVLVFIFQDAYGASLPAMWKDIWTDANASVAFMTVDAIVLFAAFLLYIGYFCGEGQALRAVSVTAILGPAAACCLVLMDAEAKEAAEFVIEDKSDAKKKD